MDELINLLQSIWMSCGSTAEVGIANEIQQAITMAQALKGAQAPSDSDMDVAMTAAIARRRDMLLDAIVQAMDETEDVEHPSIDIWVASLKRLTTQVTTQLKEALQ